LLLLLLALDASSNSKMDPGVRRDDVMVLMT
jgi:hypothetical protein